MLYTSICSLKICPDGEIGRHKRLKISRSNRRAGSIPAPGTIVFLPLWLNWLEQATHNRWVTGSSPVGGTNL
jgi:hypothetical protein